MEWLKKVEPLNWLLVMFPVTLVLRWTGMSETWIFLTACLAIVPLAGLMGKSTEILSESVGPGLGGLLNATFGNAAELIIAIFALRAGQINVVKGSITGSVLGNVLLVLGASFLAGGLKFKRQTFNSTAAGVSSGLLLLAAIGLVIPAIFEFELRMTGNSAGDSLSARENAISVEISVVLLAIYCFMLLFSLRTHKHLYAGEEKQDWDVKPEQPAHEHWPLWLALTVLSVATVMVAIMSESLVGAIEGTRERFGWSEQFVGVIVVAIVGNAAEHSTAVMVALKNRMELSFQIAVGSAIQVALFVAPVLVLLSYAPGFPRPLNLHFTSLEVVALLVSVMAIALVAQDGESNWLEGVLLLGVYLILAIAFLNLPATEEPKHEPKPAKVSYVPRHHPVDAWPVGAAYFEVA